MFAALTAEGADLPLQQLLSWQFRSLILLEQFCIKYEELENSSVGGAINISNVQRRKDLLFISVHFETLLLPSLELKECAVLN